MNTWTRVTNAKIRSGILKNDGNEQGKSRVLIWLTEGICPWIYGKEFGHFTHWASCGGSKKNHGSGGIAKVPGSVSGSIVSRIGSGTGFRTRGLKVAGSEGSVPKVSKVSVFDVFRQVWFCFRGLDGTGSGDAAPDIPKVTEISKVAEVPGK